MSSNDEDKTINSHGAGFYAAGAAADVRERNAAAYKKYQEFFDRPEFNERIDAARKVLEDFFPVKDIYENMRENRGNPYVVLKVTNHVFPKVSLSEKDRRYRNPLKELGVEIVFSKGTNSYLYRIN
jgi:hypothetical protein